MAELRDEAGNIIKEFESIVAAVEPLGVRLGSWPVGDDPELTSLLARDVLSKDENDRVQGSFQPRFEELKKAYGCVASDLVVLHPDVADLDEKLERFSRCHIHPDYEIRYVIDGEGVFGVVLPDGSQVELTVQAAEYVCVPKGLEHWFRLSDKRRIKCLRYFTEVDSWTADFTGTEVRMTS